MLQPCPSSLVTRGTVMGHVFKHDGQFGGLRLNPRIRTAEEAASAFECPVIALAPRLDSGPDRVLTVLREPYGRLARAFRRITASVADVHDDPTVILISSAVREEGRTTVAIASALLFAAAGRRTLLIDADLQRSGVGDATGLERLAGLTTILLGRARFVDVVQPWQLPNLDVLTSGETPPNPGDLITSSTFDRVVKQAAGGYDTVVIDGPPILPAGDPVRLARVATATLVSVRVGRSRRRDLCAASAALSNAGLTVNGIVVTGVPHREHLAPPGVRSRLTRPERIQRRLG